MTDDSLVVRPAARLRGTPALPGDKSISHRALLFALLAEGESRIAAAGDGEDVRSTAGLVAALGATVERVAERDGRVDYRVVSPGGDALTEPDEILDCGNSGTTARLAAGVLAGRLAVRRARRRRVAPAAADGPDRGAAAPDGRQARRPGRGDAPAARHHRPVRPHPDHATRRRSRAPRSSPRSCWPAWRPTARPGHRGRRDARPHRAHAAGPRRGRRRGRRARRRPHRPRRRARPRSPPSTRPSRPIPSGAAFWLVAGSIHPDAELRLEGVSTNPTRRAIIDILRRMGADIEEHDRPAVGGADGEPLADLVVRSSAAAGRRPVACRGGRGDRRDPGPGAGRRGGHRNDAVPWCRRAQAQGVRPDRRDRGRARRPRRGRARRGRRHRDPRWPAA